jgi:DNA polymerase-4
MDSPDHDQNTAEARDRKIIHIDMDAFYASVEQRDNPDLRGKPVAVGGSRERGVVAAASYEARRFGVRSAMPSVTAKRQCPDLIFVMRFEVYKEISRHIRTIFAEHTEIIEPVSLDEAYLDATENIQGIASATELATMIRAKILSETGLTASAGISYNKFLAKLASDQNKPNGQFVITPKMGPAFVQDLPVGKFHGIGPATSAKMHGLGIFTGMDMRNQTLDFMTANFGKAGAYYYWISRGIDERPVRANRIRKSVGAENTFSQDLADYEALTAELQPLIEKVWRHCETTVGTRANSNAETRVATARRNHSIAGQKRALHDPERVSLSEAARICGVSHHTIQRLVEAGLLKREQVTPRAPWEVSRRELDAEPIRSVIERLHRTGKLVLQGGCSEDQLALFTEKSRR